jgi:hypothetical protein
LISASIIDGHALLQLLWSATAASFAVCISFALALRALSSASAARRAGRSSAALLYGLGAFVPGACCVGALIVAGLVLVNG